MKSFLNTLKTLQKRKVYYNQLATTLKKITPNPPAEITKYHNILFCPVTLAEVNTIREGIIAKYISRYDIKVAMLYDDLFHPISTFYKNKIEFLATNLKINQNINFCQSAGLSTIRLSSSNKTIPNVSKPAIDATLPDFEYQGIKIGDLIVSEVIRKVKCFAPQWEDAHFRSETEKSIEAAIRYVHLYQDLLHKGKYDKIVMSHAIYLNWGILFRLARSKGLPVDVYNGSYRKNTIRFYHNVPNAPMPEHNWPLVENLPLNAQQQAKVDAYIETRVTQKNDNISLFSGEESNTQQLYQRIEQFQQKGATIFALYPNIAWDAYSFSGEAAVFESMRAWLEQTIEYFQKNQEHLLIIKAHPAEAYFKVPMQYRVRAVVAQYELPENILFLDETVKINSFKLYDTIDYGIINISTVGLELALKSKTVLTSGAKGQYSNKGFTLDPESKESYFEMIDQLSQKQLTFEPDLEAAHRYLYFRFFREALELDFLNLENIYSFNSIQMNSLEELDDHASFQTIIKGILTDALFLNPDDQ